MKKIAVASRIAAIAVCLLPAALRAEAPGACTLLTEADAVARTGGPLGSAYKQELKPAAENGYDHTTVCGFYPKGYDIQKAEAPPERGMMLSLHAMRKPEDAKAFYDNTALPLVDLAKSGSGPFAGAKVKPITGIGQAAMLDVKLLKMPSGAESTIATVWFLKGAVYGQVQVWKKGGDPEPIARDAAKAFVAKLP